MANDQDLDQLFGQLGAAYAASSLSGGQLASSNWDFIKVGREFWDRNLEKIKQAVCVDWRGCDKLEEIRSKENEERILESLVDVLSAFISGVPVILLAKLVLKLGVDRMCDCSSKLAD